MRFLQNLYTSRSGKLGARFAVRVEQNTTTQTIPQNYFDTNTVDIQHSHRIKKFQCEQNWVVLVAISQIAVATASKQFKIQATVLTENNTELLYLNDNQFGPFEAGNHYEWFGSNQIVKVDTNCCLQVQPGVHQGCAGQAWTCDGWNYIGTENYRGYDICNDSSDRWVAIESAQTVGYPDEPVVLLKEHNSGMCAYLDTLHENDENVLYLGLGDCDATNRAQLVLTVYN